MMIKKSSLKVFDEISMFVDSSLVVMLLLIRVPVLLSRGGTKTKHIDTEA